MKMNGIFRTPHAFVTVDFPHSTAERLKNADGNLRKIHVFAFDPENVNVRSLIATAERFRKDSENGRRRTLIVHTFDRKQHAVLRKKLKGTEKGRWFHLSLMKREPMEFALAPNHSIFVRNGEIEELWIDDAGKMRIIGRTTYFGNTRNVRK